MVKLLVNKVNKLIKLAFGFVLLSNTALAGQTCQKHGISPLEFEKAANLALRLKQQLDLSGTHLAIIARAGSDLSEYKLKYSHAAFVWHDVRSKKWIVSHLLHSCGQSKSGLFDQGLINFFIDTPFEYRVKILIPEQKFQDTLISMLKNGAGWALHKEKYNLVSYPNSKKYQNSNHWLLELLVHCSANITLKPYQQIKQQYQADKLHISRTKRLASIMSKDTHFSDQPLSARLKNSYQIVSVRSLFRFMQQQGFVSRVVEII